MRSTNINRLERWLGPSAVENLARTMHGWYGPPIALADVPGEVYVTNDDFVGYCKEGGFASVNDMAWDAAQRVLRLWNLKTRHNQLNVGFASLAAVRTAHQIRRDLPFTSGAFDGTTAASHCYVLDFAASGGVGMGGMVHSTGATAAPGGRVPVGGSDAGFTLGAAPTGMAWYFGGATFVAESGSINSPATPFLLYDRLFDVAKTMSNTTTEAVTGVPTRYQSTTTTDWDYIGGNFVFPYVSGATPLGGTAHSWTVCTYNNQANSGATLPSQAGVASMSTPIIDITAGPQFWMPLAAGDVGIKSLTQLQCSASVTGTIDFVIGHPLAFLTSHVATILADSGGVTSAFNMVRIGDTACLQLLKCTNAIGGQTMISGNIMLLSG